MNKFTKNSREILGSLVTRNGRLYFGCSDPGTWDAMEMISAGHLFVTVDSFFMPFTILYA